MFRKTKVEKALKSKLRTGGLGKPNIVEGRTWGIGAGNETSIVPEISIEIMAKHGGGIGKNF